MREETPVDKIYTKYIRKIHKKIEGKPMEIKLIMFRTLKTGCMILAELQDLSFRDLTMGTYLFSKDIRANELVRYYDAEMELAGIDEEKFLFGLHSFYQKTSIFIKKNHLSREYAEFLGAVLSIHRENDNSVSRAYIDLLIQTMEYLRPDKFNLGTTICGVNSITGEFLVVQEPYPYLDAPILDTEKELLKHPRSLLDVQKKFHIAFEKYGIYYSSEEELEKLCGYIGVRTTVIGAIMPYISEYTYDIVPQKVLYTNRPPLLFLSLALQNPYDILDLLHNRKRILPANGVKFEFNDPTGELQSALLQEIFDPNTDAVILLYRICLEDGDMSGYYNTRTEYFYSVAEHIQENIETKYSFGELYHAFVLLLYASQVTNADLDLNHIFIQDREFVSVECFSKGNKLKSTYQSSKKTMDMEAYDSKEVSINGYIRKLPTGAKASEQAVEMARQYGYELDGNETFVRPFIKQVYVRREDSDSKTQ